jgi:hypothetical protein
MARVYGDLVMSPIIPEWYMVDGGYTTPTGSLEVAWVNAVPVSATSATITFATTSGTPGSFGGAGAGTSSFNDPDFVINTNTGSYTVTNLSPGVNYTIRVRAYTGANATGSYGEYKYAYLSMPKTANVGTMTSTTSQTTTPYDTVMTRALLDKLYRDNLDNQLDDGPGIDTSSSSGSSYATSGNRTVQRSLFRITADKDTSKYAVSVKNTNISTGYSRYAFGAGVIFASTLTKPESRGGIGFFVSNSGMNGYFVEIQTDASNKDLKDKSLKVYKVVGGQRVYLPDSQDTDSGKLYGGVIAATQYKLDVDVVITSEKTTINVYVNSFKVTAIDQKVEGSTNPISNPISPTSQIAMFANIGEVNFDYIYASPISSNQDGVAEVRGLYEGQYSGSTLNFLYGEKIAQNFNSPETKVGFLEEFGTVARELRYVKTNYSQPAALPLYATTGVNKFATVLGSKFSNHGAEIFVLNNAGTFIPLSYGTEQKFWVVGNYVDNGSQHEYTETTTNEYTVLEPATFQSNWIQSESDAKSLFTWIKNQWSKQQQSINMEVFGNPAIEVGDIITVNYPDNNLNGTQKFLVTNVNIGFEEGVSTTITARSIYS